VRINSLNHNFEVGWAGLPFLLAISHAIYSELRKVGYMNGKVSELELDDPS